MNPVSKIKAPTRAACAFAFAICAAVNTLNAFTVSGNLVLNGDAETGNLNEWTTASDMNAKDSGVVAGLEAGPRDLQLGALAGYRVRRSHQCSTAQARL